MSDLFQYLNYRHFLKDYYLEEKKKKGARFSFRLLSQRAGFRSPNFFKLVMEDKRNLGPDGVRGCIQALHLNKEQSSFFENLVLFNQAGNDLDRNRFYQKLSHSRRYREIKKIEKDYFVYYSRWYYAAIRELVLLPDFREDPEWIASKLAPPITTREAAVALELLLELGFLKRGRAGRLVQVDRNISTDREVVSLAIANFHREMIRKASESIERASASQRDISSLTVAISKEKFEEAKRRIQDFRRELNLLLSEGKEFDSVYQINFQVYNLTEVRW
jgi:uncharacterized protein (TIGR02147 family)